MSERESGDWIRGIKRVLISELGAAKRAWEKTPMHKQQSFLETEDARLRAIAQVRLWLP